MGMLDWIEENIIDPVEETIVDPLLEAGGDAVDFVDDNVVDPLVEAAESTVDWFDENVFDPVCDTAEDIGDWIEDVAENVSDGIEDCWNELTEFGEDLWDDIVEAAGDAWETIVDNVEDAWEWLCEEVEDAVEWLATMAEKVYEFVVEEAIPFIIALVETIPAVIRALGALLILPVCYLYKELFGEEESTILEAIAEHEPRMLEEFLIERLPLHGKYAIFSDVHMFVDGNLDFYNNNGNSEIYTHALREYAGAGYHLIENGDIEDFWMRGTSPKTMIFTISDQLPWPYFAGAFEASAFQSTNQIHALNVFMNNATTYATIRSLFCEKGRYTRVIGNHDDVWSDPLMMLSMSVFYPGLQINDYCTLDNESTGKAGAILAHGHQSDLFNMPMCNFAGKEVTNLATVMYELTFGEWDWLRNKLCKDKEKWEDEWDGKGFNNELQDTEWLKLQSFSECDLYKGLEDIYGDSPSQPYLILGHTHNPKDNAGVPGFLSSENGKWNEYSNSGTVGMWEEIVFGLEVVYPDIKVVAWKKESGGLINRHILKDYGDDKVYLKA